MSSNFDIFGLLLAVLISCVHSEFDVRLASGPNDHHGRLEVKSIGEWGTVCDSGWTEQNEKVICHQLGFGEPVRSFVSTFPVNSSQNIHLDNVICYGPESTLSTCSYSPIGNHICDHRSDVAIECSVESQDMVRLVDGVYSNSGYVEVFLAHQGWLKVCDDERWTERNKEVICSTIGYDMADTLYYNISSAAVNSTFFMDCQSNQNMISNCTGKGTTLPNEQCQNLVKLQCLNEDDVVSAAAGIRFWKTAYNLNGIYQGYDDHVGSVETYFFGVWGTMCSRGWSQQNSEVVCRELGFEGAEGLIVAVDRPVVKLNHKFAVQCIGSEQRLSDCPVDLQSISYGCTSGEEVAIRCKNSTRLRLVDENANGMVTQGRVEYLSDNGEWGTVCNKTFTMAEAAVVCRNLNLGNAVEIFTSPASDTARISITTVNCAGDEGLLSSCFSSRSTQDDCTHTQDVGVQCRGGVNPVRLVPHPYEGHVEIKKGDKWGTVCGNDWSLKNADVVCKQLGYGGRDDDQITKDYVETKDIILDNVDCVGDEGALSECPHGEWFQTSCTDSNAYDFGVDKAYVTCSQSGFPLSAGEVRLVGGKTSNEGILQIIFDGKWGTVCSKNWQEEKAVVVCSQLGYPGVRGHSENRYLYQLGNTEDLPINAVKCVEKSYTLGDCEISTPKLTECSHSSDVALSCEVDNKLQLGDLRLFGDEDKKGILLMYHNDQWKNICGKEWKQDEADVACKQLGYKYASDVDYTLRPGSLKYKEMQQTILDARFECQGNEKMLLDCIKPDLYICEHQFVQIECSTEDKPDEPNVRLIVGIALAVLVIVTIVVIAAVCYAKRNQSAETAQPVPLSEKPSAAPPSTAEPVKEAMLPPEPAQV